MAKPDTSPDDPRAARQALLRALTILGGPAQAQRRTTQLGSFQGICRLMEKEGARAGELRAAGVLTGSQAAIVEEVRARLIALRESREDFLEERRAAPRDFLWSHALEDEEWSALRHLARRGFTEMTSEDSPPDAGGGPTNAKETK